MNVPIYQIEAYQKAPHKVKHNGITKKSATWSWQLKRSKACEKAQQNQKKILKISNKPCGIEKWIFQSTRLKRTKKPRPKEDIPASLKNPQIGPRNWKTTNVCKKIDKIHKNY